MKTRRTERAGKAVGGGGVSWGGRVAYFKEGKHKQEEMRRLGGDITNKGGTNTLTEELQALFNMKLQHCTVCIHDRKSYRADFFRKSFQTHPVG